MSRFGIGDKDLAENLFTLALQADASFDQQFEDALHAGGIQLSIQPEDVDHRELLIFLCWLARRVVAEEKVLNALQVAYFLTSSHSPFSGEDGQRVFQTLSQRYYEYDQAMINAPEPLDVVYVGGQVARRVMAHRPDVLVHLPRVEIILAHLFTQWIVSIGKTLKELV